MEVPGGEGSAARLVAVAFVLSVGALLVSEAAASRMRRRLE